MTAVGSVWTFPRWPVKVRTRPFAVIERPARLFRTGHRSSLRCLPRPVVGPEADWFPMRTF